jgi:hypothetical protein
LAARRCTWVYVAALLLVATLSPRAEAQAQALLVVQSTVGKLVTGQLPDSVRLKIFTAMAGGKMEAVGSAYMTHKGLHDSPQWLRAFQNVFTVANKEMGRCKQVAEVIYTAFKQFGANPEYVKIFSTGNQRTDFLSWQSKIIMSNNNYHVAVRYNQKIYDAYTSMKGMIESEYLASIHAEGVLRIVVMEVP